MTDGIETAGATGGAHGASVSIAKLETKLAEARAEWEAGADAREIEAAQTAVAVAKRQLAAAEDALANVKSEVEARQAEKAAAAAAEAEKENA